MNTVIVPADEAATLFEQRCSTAWHSAWKDGERSLACWQCTPARRFGADATIPVDVYGTSTAPPTTTPSGGLAENVVGVTAAADTPTTNHLSRPL